VADNTNLLYLELDTSSIDALVKKFEGAEQILKGYAADLATQIHAKVVELATNGPDPLHMRRDRYLAALSFEKVNDRTWLINLDADAVWIEEGLPENYQMLDHLLASRKAKTAKDGSKYVVVPFKHNGSTHLSSQAGKTNDDLKAALQETFKRNKIPWGIERDINTGKPKLGLIHDKLLVHPKDHPLKTHEGIGQGHGSIGNPREGHTGDRFLDRVRVYQRAVGGKKPKIVKGVMTFRTASSKQDKSKYWVHPGTAPKKYLDKAYEWALNEWEKNMLPQITNEIMGD
jgi:hypothetical protein